MESKMETLIRSILDKRLLTHVLFWSSYFLLAILYALGFGQPILVTLILKSILLPIQIAAYYTFVYLQLPLIPKRKYLEFILSFILTSYVFSTLAHLQNDFGMGLYLSSWHKPHDLLHILKAKSFLFTYLTDIYILVFCVTAIRLIHHYFKSKTHVESLLTAKAKTEYNYINSRLQPEFLLRSLKLIEETANEDQQKASRQIENISTILDYSLYKGLEDLVTIEEELENLRLFISTYVDGSEIINSYEFNAEKIPSAIETIKPLHLIKLTSEKLSGSEKLGEKHAKLVLGFENGIYSYE